MQLKIKQIGNSLYVLIPKTVANAMGLREGDVIDIDLKVVNK